MKRGRWLTDVGTGLDEILHLGRETSLGIIDNGEHRGDLYTIIINKLPKRREALSLRTVDNEPTGKLVSTLRQSAQ
jgi:hypothetical protein